MRFGLRASNQLKLPNIVIGLDFFQQSQQSLNSAALQKINRKPKKKPTTYHLYLLQKKTANQPSVKVAAQLCAATLHA